LNTEVVTESRKYNGSHQKQQTPGTVM